MGQAPRLEQIIPTVFLRGPQTDLEQLVRVSIAVALGGQPVKLVISGPGFCRQMDLGSLAPGTCVHEAMVPAMDRSCSLRFALQVAGQAVDEREVTWSPPRRWRVHVVQHSHHDVGYTNLSSTVLREHWQFLEEALEMAQATRDFSDEARFRLVIEQAWSLQEFMRRASVGSREAMAQLLRAGDLELTALFGNMITELCGHEELVRALYPSARLAREHGFGITTAEHNDIPGMSWGLAQVLVSAGIRFFCPQLPRYWSWCDPPMRSFWEDAALFPDGQPGGFWWEAPSGGRVLLWDSFGSGGDVSPDLAGLGEALDRMAQAGYRYDVVYWPVRGGARDNSPYISGFAETAHEWNDRWTYPRLITSTNAMFFAELAALLPADLPTFRGDLPGPDYPLGSASTAGPTAANRVTHWRLLTAERIATCASAVTDHAYPEDDLRQAFEETLWHDEHTWGHHFPAGPAATASETEKAVHAHRAAALAHDITSRGLARIADHVQLPGDGLYLVVFNPLPHSRTATVSVPLREIENCGSVMVAAQEESDPQRPPYLRGVPLTDRWHVHPPAEVVQGWFDLVDAETGQQMEFQITALRGPDDTVPDAPQRYGLSQGGKRYGFFEVPDGLGRDLRFVARDLPPVGYRTYELRPWPRDATRQATGTRRRRRDALVIENGHYRVRAESGRITSLVDLEADRELLDPGAPHGLGELVVRDPHGAVFGMTPTGCTLGHEGPVYRSLELAGCAPGHPRAVLTLGLWENVKRVDLAVRVMKDPTPLLETFLAFPFAVREPSFRYEATLSAVTPPQELLPGAYWDAVAVHNWVEVSGGGQSLLWSSLDAPVVSLGGLHPGYISPAHRCVMSEHAEHPPAGPEALLRGWLYSLLFANNFGTNFAVSQTGSVLFRYCFTTRSGAQSDRERAVWGWEATMPVEAIFTRRRRPGHLPLADSLLELSGDPVALLTCKRAEDGRGFVIRLWNPERQVARCELRARFAGRSRVCVTGLTEDDTHAPLEAGRASEMQDGSVAVQVEPRSLLTVRLLPAHDASGTAGR